MDLNYAPITTSQLTRDGAATFSYDPTGNRTDPGYSTGSGNELTTDGVSTYTHDANGNVTQSTVGAAGTTWAYTYDNRNQMLTAALSATPGGTVTQRVTYGYDAFGVRISRAAWNGTTTTTEHYGIDGWDPAKPEPEGTENYDVWADLDGSNALTMRRTFTAAFDGLVARQNAAGVVAYYLTDRQGSVRLVVDNSATTIASTTFDASGKILSGTLSDRFGYTGQPQDAITGLISLGNGKREDNPTTDELYQPDPGGFAASGPNLFTYVGNNPTNATDPSGKILFIQCGDSNDKIAKDYSKVEEILNAKIKGLLKGADADVSFGGSLGEQGKLSYIVIDGEKDYKTIIRAFGQISGKPDNDEDRFFR